MKQESYKTHLSTLIQLKDLLGQEVGISPWIEITQANIDTFAKITQDEQWIHTDVERSKRESPYKQTIAHGFMVLSYGSRIAYECMQIDDVIMGVNYGLNKVRFVNATPSGARIRGRIKLSEYEEIENGGKYSMSIIFEIEGHDKPACVAEFIGIGYTNQ